MLVVCFIKPNPGLSLSLYYHYIQGTEHPIYQEINTVGIFGEKK